VGQKLSEDFHQQVVVDNRAGSSPVIGSEIVVKASPDEYALLLVHPD
jgi:tripartite-type tricarboxylate transporter receptor subunit TctC